jgi:Rrf2 family protein
MWVTTKGRYGLRAMIELARSHGKGPIQMSYMSEELGLSRKYLHTLLSQLRDAGLVNSHRGAGGGFSLTKPPTEINVAELITALEDCEILVDCVRNSEFCDRDAQCVARELWSDLGKEITSYLSKIMLQDLVDKQDRLGIPMVKGCGMDPAEDAE